MRSIYWIIWLIKWDAEFFLIFGCSSKVNGCTGSLPRSLPVKYEADEIKRRQKEEKTQREAEPVMA